MMFYGGNNRAQSFFKQHGWTDGGKIEAKYTSRAADLYRQLLAKEVAKSSTEDGNSSWPSSPVSASQAPNQTAAFSDLKLTEASKENASEKTEPEIVRSPRAPTHSFKKPIGAKKPGNKTGGLGARKLTSKVCFTQCTWCVSMILRAHCAILVLILHMTSSNNICFPMLCQRSEKKEE
jgi:ADP-ribosylation factor GTPase-activating protein 2/3